MGSLFSFLFCPGVRTPEHVYKLLINKGVIMPKYDYKCSSCGSTIEFERGIGEDREPSCCSNTMTRIWNSVPGVMFNGSGFYSTDNRK